MKGSGFATVGGTVTGVFVIPPVGAVVTVGAVTTLVIPPVGAGAGAGAFVTGFSLE